jgi:maltooligosyltrehalose trehalohydrolase
VAEFAVWAPKPERVRLDVDGFVHPMARSGGGWWRAAVDTAPDARYGYLLDDDPTVLPDPRSARQPDGVHERSALWDASAAGWTDGDWAGRAVAGAVIYELHLGTFTPGGTFDSAVEKLDYLVGLGVDFVELMPVNAFSGPYGWGYDGVLWYAVHEPYGGPDGLVRFVDACHRRGLGVLIDAVFNHLGPSGNYLPRFGPYLSSASNPWGEGINIADADSDEVRRYIIDCALRWMRDFHADGLRLDAVHALVDTTAIHILEELATETDTLAAQLGRPLSLIAESDLNDPRLITPRDCGGYGITAQWDDDIHHAIHTVVSGERQGYYADFGTLATLAKTLRGGFFHAATYSSFRRRRHGRPLDTAKIPATRLLAYTCTHDQVGNRAIGDRPSRNLSPGQLAVKAALVLGSPYTAMLFMGEEWGASTPFQFFSSHPEPELARSTAEGRKAEFAEHGWDAEEIPDPQDPATFARSKLDWAEADAGQHTRLLRTYRELIALRRNEFDLADPWLGDLMVDYDEDQCWIVMRRGRLTIACNLGTETVRIPATGEVLLAWDSPSVGDNTTELPAHSFVVLAADRRSSLSERERHSPGWRPNSSGSKAKSAASERVID